MKKQHKVSKGLTWAFFLNITFAIIELVGGILTNSTAIITDAFHDFMDSLAIGIAVFMDRYSRKSPSSTFNFGYRRFSLLSGIILSGILSIGAIFMMYHAITSFSVVKEVNSFGMLGLAVLGIAINTIAFLRIKNDGESHAHHNHSHHTAQDANSKAIMLHLLEDVLGWIAVLVGAIIMYFTKWYWIDALLTFLIGLFITYNAVTNLYSTFKILLQAVPNTINIEDIKEKLSNISGIIEVTDFKAWSLDGIDHVANIRIKISEIQHYQTIQTEIKNLLTSNYNFKDITIEMI